MSEKIIGFVEALKVVLAHAGQVRRLAVERCGLLDSAERVLADEVRADRDQPPFDRATRDGFAVQAEALNAGRKLEVVGMVRAGEIWGDAACEAGQAIEIMTGAPMPAGADAVVMIEHVEQGGGAVWAADGRALSAGDNVVPRGSEARRGALLLAPGTVMGAAEIALAAACGQLEVAVYVRPVVTIVATGDELVELDQAPEPQQIRNSNSYALAAMVAAAGGVAERMAIARDTREDVRARIERGRRADLLLLSGGVSAGKYDLVEEVLAEFGAEFLFTGVRMQPGKPVVFGRLRRSVEAEGWTYFFGLPGNPISTQVTFHCFVEPLLRAMCGTELAGPMFVQATLGEAMRGKTGLTRVLPARLQRDLDRPTVTVVGWQGSGDQAANARANCYAVLPDGRDLSAGDVVTVLLR